MEKQKSIKKIDESIFPNQELYETEQDATVIEIPLARELTESESNEYAQRLADMMFEQGYTDFDIEISTSSDEVIEEITLDGNDFFEEFGVMWYNEDDTIDEAEYQGRKVTLGKPIRSSNGPKKFHVFVRNPKGNVVKVNFGDPDMKIKKSNPERRRSFRARHNCDNPGPRHRARYWSCRAW